MKVELKLIFDGFFCKFMRIRNRAHRLWIQTKFKAQKSILVGVFTQRDCALGKNSHFQLHVGVKKNRHEGKLIGEFLEYFQDKSLEQYEQLFDLSCYSEINTRQLLIWLSLFLFAKLYSDYSQEEEFRILNLEHLG